ncbi:hypothetical protein F383_11380 [Gossypium arboreum]|uniref:Uncharacterized protein n=1 Tax=Gossypium arboreum TaxID=29729 RepID=A0A0B0PZC4_GOSAR|nr:hypothetical protein F383_11380 [Gossypium arboreum]
MSLPKNMGALRI